MTSIAHTPIMAGAAQKSDVVRPWSPRYFPAHATNKAPRAVILTQMMILMGLI